MKKPVLTADEMLILDAFEAGKLVSVKNVNGEEARITALVRANLHKNKRVSLRLTESDFLKVRETALREGLAYQSLLSSIIHKYLTGQLSVSEKRV